MRKRFFVWGIGALVLLMLAIAQTQADQEKMKPAPAPFKPGEAVVKLKKGPAGQYSALAHNLLMTLGKRYAVTLRPFKTDKTLYTVKTGDSSVDMNRFLADIRATGQVAYAEPNFIYHTSTFAEDPIKAIAPNDPDFGKDWGLLNVGQNDPKTGMAGLPGVDIGATKAWVSGTGSKDIVVAVIDTGVDYNHEELKENIFLNTKEVDGNGKDDDGNGFVDDVHGWNFEGKNNNPMDDNSHGTHCSGTIGAKGGNGIGTAGVNWNVSILPIKFLSASGSGTLDDAVEGIKYATLMGVNVMSNSWGGGGFSQTMYDAIKAAKEKGILFVAAAGNEGNDNDASPAYPATYDLDNVIAVAATDNRDRKASWSSFGQTKVHLAAPGVNIFSTVPMDKGKYEIFSGTSMATPHVSGAAALLWSLNKSMTYAEIKSRLLATVDPVHALKRKTVTGGRLNVYNAINNIVPPRNEPPADQWKSVAKVYESKHPYDNAAKETIEIAHPGAKFIRVHFSKIATEQSYDILTVKATETSDPAEEISGSKTDYTTEYVVGDKLIITFQADGSNTDWGFAIDHYDFID
jgi:subtilisin family serine protease